MALYLGKQIQSELQAEFTNYAKFELLDAAINSVFSTQRSGSNEIFLRTAFQYAKAELRKKLISYFDDAELAEYDTKARKKKDLWQQLIRDKKEKLMRIFEEQKAEYWKDSKVGIVGDNNASNMYVDDKANAFGCLANTNYPPSTQQQQLQKCSNGNSLQHNQANTNLSVLPFTQPLLMDITLTYPNNQSNKNNLNQIPPCHSCMNFKQLNIQIEAERDHWKSQYQALLQQYLNLLQCQNNPSQMPELIGNQNGFCEDNGGNENVLETLQKQCSSMPLIELVRQTSKDRELEQVTAFPMDSNNNVSMPPYSDTNINSFEHNNNSPKNEFIAPLFGGIQQQQQQQNVYNNFPLSMVSAFNNSGFIGV